MRKDRILIYGSRKLVDPTPIIRIIRGYIHNDITVIEGESKGADLIARVIAEFFGIQVDPYEAYWDQYGKRAGFLRNQRMIEEGQPTRAFGFYVRGAENKGSLHMTQLVTEARIPFAVYIVDQNEFKPTEKWQRVKYMWEATHNRLVCDDFPNLKTGVK